MEGQQMFKKVIRKSPYYIKTTKLLLLFSPLQNYDNDAFKTLKSINSFILMLLR